MSSPYNMQQQHPSQSLSGGPHPPIASVTTELIQKYLDENKQLILAILDNQNLGKLNECAVFQQKLQSNLMFLAAVADAQTQPPPVHGQLMPTHRPPGVQYLTHPQAQKQMAPQSMLRNSIQYTPHEVAAIQQAKLQQPQQGMHGQGAGGHHVFPMNPSEVPMQLNSLMPSRGYSGGGIPEHMQLNRGSSVEMRTGNRLSAMDMGTVSGEGGQVGSAHGNAGSGVRGEMGQSYAKPANEGEN